MITITAASVGVRIGNIMQLIGVLLIFVLVLALTYFVTKWIASYQQGHASNKNIQVIETMKLTPNKYIQIVKVGDEYLVLGIGKDEITMLTKLTEEQVKDFSAEKAMGLDYKNVGESFGEIFNKMKERFPKK